MKGLGNWWGGLTSQQKLVFVLIIIAFIWIVRNAIKGAVRGAEGAVQNVSETAVLQASGIKPSYSDSQYKAMAQKLFDAMDGAGTYDDDVYAVFDKLNNDIDFIKLDKAFGVREASDNLFGAIPSEDMRGWIRDDLSAAQIVTLNKRLKANGVSKRF
jgi:hypothetical protein